MIQRILRLNALTGLVLALWFLIYPAIRAVIDLQDAALQKPGVPRLAWRLARTLAPRYETWARARVADGRATTLSTGDISGTEWPVFGSVFYLWALENLQAAWDAGDRTSDRSPKEFSRDAIAAASELVIDSGHATWVRQHWGENHLHRENVFYRMLVIASLTSRARLLADGAHLGLLRDQVETLAQELDASSTGLLDDYPGECYPGDVMAALMCIRRADAVLATDHRAMIQRAVRAFVGKSATPQGLPPYAANSRSGLPISETRGCANSYMALTAPELWPEQAQEWFEQYDRLFWQERTFTAGYREFLPSARANTEWTMDVDAGPVVAGHGVSACAFGLGAARKNGRFDRAYPLAAEMLVTLGQLPNGVLAVPRLLSNLADAPMLGEAALLWQLTIQPEAGVKLRTGGSVPWYVPAVLMAFVIPGCWRVRAEVRKFRQTFQSGEPNVPAQTIQLVAWAGLTAGAAILIVSGHGLAGTIVLVLSLQLPIRKTPRLSTSSGFDHRPEGVKTA